jgi:hypothetical protein
MVLRKIPMLLLVCWNSDPDGSSDQAVRFVRTLTVIDAENDFPRAQQFDTLFFGDAFAKRRVDARDQNQVAVG